MAASPLAHDLDQLENKMMTINYHPYQPLLTASGLRRFSLTLKQCLPNKSLIGIVHSYLQVETSGPTPYPFMPDGTQAIFVSNDTTSLSGGINQAAKIYLPARGEYFGIRFYPGVLRHLFKLDLGEIGNGFVDGSFLPVRFFSYLHEHLYDNNGFYERARTCDEHLLKQLSPQRENVFDQALGLIQRSRGNISIDQGLAKKLGISARHLNRLFQRHTGFSTQAFARTVRFQQAAQQLATNPKQSKNVALSNGYFDQAHLLKDFKNRLGLNPQEFFSQYRSE